MEIYAVTTDSLGNSSTTKIGVKCSTWSGGESRVIVDEAPLIHSDQCGGVIFEITTRINSARDHVDLLLAMEALVQMAAAQGIEDVEFHLFIPYLPYARQERMTSVTEAVSLKTFLSTLAIFNVTTIISDDIHEPVAATKLANDVGIENVINKDSTDAITKFLYNNDGVISPYTTDLVIVAPDEGAKERAMLATHCLDDHIPTPVIVVEKTRDPETGHIIRKPFDHDLTGKDVLIIDDICDGGRTFMGLAAMLKECGANKVILFVTHGIFSRGIGEYGMNIDNIDAIFTTTSFASYDSYHSRFRDLIEENILTIMETNGL